MTHSALKSKSDQQNENCKEIVIWLASNDWPANPKAIKKAKDMSIASVNCLRTKQNALAKISKQKTGHKWWRKLASSHLLHLIFKSSPAVKKLRSSVFADKGQKFRPKLWSTQLDKSNQIKFSKNQATRFAKKSSRKIFLRKVKWPANNRTHNLITRHLKKDKSFRLEVK